MRSLLPMLGTALFALLATAGCSLADDGGKTGELGNGGFYFSCEDAVACTKYSNDASKFPSQVALSSTFSVRFVPKTGSSGISFNEGAADRGITIQPVGDFVSRGPKGLVAIKSGHVTLASRDAKGTLVDYVVVRIVRPDALVVYSADESRADPPRVDTVELTVGSRRSYRAFAQEKKADLAGSLQVEWSTEDPSIAVVDNTTDGKATVSARAPGSTNLVAVGGTFTQKIAVQVSP